ncbi:MAG: class I SAM-dependent methyltransferase [Spirochaetes bacterium]|nr:class I SAM-dependent methyltransferase [Spirochaetota bacterium]
MFNKDACETFMPESPYTYMAEHYDYILNHVDYVKWYTYIKTIMYLYTGYPDRILEIGTGTGRFGAFFSRDNYTIYGMDCSLEMLKIARLRAFKNFRVFCGDARNFASSVVFGFIFSVHDTMNYLLSYEELFSAFSCIADCMDDRSVFLFDLTTEYNIVQNFASQGQQFRHGSATIKWQNNYDPHNKIIQSWLTFNDGTEKKMEEHNQRVYTVKEILPILEKCGLYLVDRFADYHFEAPDRKSIMENYIVKKRV